MKIAQISITDRELQMAWCMDKPRKKLNYKLNPIQGGGGGGGTLCTNNVMYQRRLQIPPTSSLLMVLYTEISEFFCTSFRLALVSKIL